MEICTYCDIVHDEKNCPLCNAKDEIKDLENEVEKLREEIRNM